MWGENKDMNRILYVILIVIGISSIWQMFQVWEETNIWYVIFIFPSAIIIALGIVGLVAPKQIGDVFK